MEIKDLSLHDQTVYNISRNLIINGTEVIEIGNDVSSSVFIGRKLKEEFPDAEIFVCVDKKKSEVVNQHEFK